MQSPFTITEFSITHTIEHYKSCQKMSKAYFFCMTPFWLTDVMKTLQPKVVKAVLRLSEGRQKDVKGDYLHSLTNFLPESCLSKLTA